MRVRKREICCPKNISKLENNRKGAIKQISRYFTLPTPSFD